MHLSFYELITDPLSLLNKVFLLRLLLWLIKHCHCYLQTADTCPLRTGLRPAGRVIIMQIQLHMFKELHEWTLANNSLQYNPPSRTSLSWGHCRAEGWEGDIMTLPTVRKSTKDKELITLQLFPWSLMTSGQAGRSMHYLSPQHLLWFLEMSITSLFWRNFPICV